MNFLQPFILWGLPLILIPVVVHFLNRMRYRTVPWAAMMFLLAAMKHSTRQARLREWLVLLLRVLAVLALLFALARPLVGGWLGFAMGAAPDTVIVLLDRSVSMEMQDPATHLSKRQRALRQLSDAGREYAGSSRFVLIDSATRKPLEVAAPGTLETLSAAGATDTAADMPALLDAGLDYIAQNQCGRTEIWLASDLQASNWQPGSRRWDAVRERFAALRQDARVRVLALTEDVPDNIAVAVRDVQRRRTARGWELALTVELNRRATGQVSFPLTVVHEGARSLVNVSFDGQRHAIQYTLDLGASEAAGWGWIELPSDSNLRDNIAYFTYPENVHLQTLVLAESENARRVLRFAAAPAPQALNQSADVQTDATSLRLADVAMLVWQGAAPSGAVANVVRDFTESGGVAVFFPAGEGETGKFHVANWRTGDGPLANSKEGKKLPVGELVVTRRDASPMPGAVLATFEDGKPFLTRQASVAAGGGAIYRVATLPEREWSGLADGTVLVPMLQRMLLEGGRRLSKAANGEVGLVTGTATRLSGGAGRPQTDAGVYQINGRVVAVNRPAIEDEPDLAEEASVRTAFGSVPMRMFEDKGGDKSAAMQSEIWRWFLVAMLVLLTGEAFFAMPEAVKSSVASTRADFNVKEARR